MTAWRTRSRLAACAGALVWAGAALAQPAPPPYPIPQATAKPRSLPGVEGAPPAPDQAAAATTGAGTAGGTTIVPPRPAILGHGGGGVTVSSLGEVEGPPAGTLDAANGGLGADLWSGSARSAVEDLMSRLPIATPVASLRALARRIVLTRAAAPIGQAGEAFMTMRIRRLLAAGLIEDAAALAQIAQVPNDAGFARIQAEALLFAGAKAQLCDNTTATRLDSSEPFWIELRAYCYAMAGDDAALALTRSIMDAQNIDDEAFDTLLDDVENNVSKDPGGIDAPNALHAFLLQQVDLPVSFDTGSELGTPGLVLAFRSKANSPADRLKAAERLVRSGALSSADLIAIADAQHFSRDQFATEHAQLQQLPFLAGQALLRQAVARAAADAKPALIYEALSHAEGAGLLGIAAVLQDDALSKLAADPGLHDMAALFGRALMMTGHADDAERWLDLLDPKSPSDKAAIAQFEAELNLVAPTPERQLAAQTALGVLADQVSDKTADRAFAALTLGLYAALGQPMSPSAAAAAHTAMQATWPGRRPAPSTFAHLAAAIAAPGRRGEALMMVLDAIGPGGPGDLAPDAAAALIGDLVKLNVPDAARAIAISALLRYRPAPAVAPNASPP